MIDPFYIKTIMLVLFIGITTPLVVMRHKRLAKVKRAKKYFEERSK